jgi:hypothetical protein
MSQTIDQFVSNNNNKLINNGGIQCGAVFNQFNRDVVEGGWIGTPITGYVIDIWTEFGKDIDYQNYIRIGADQVPQKGDTAIWNKYNGNGLPHVAIVLEDQGASIKSFTQNPLPAHVESLTKKGIVGYLRPKKFIKATSPAAVNSVGGDIVAAVKRGDYGNEPQRSVNLRNAGYDPVAVQAAVNASVVAPAPTQPAPAPVASGFSVGEVVVPTSLVDYNGTPLSQYDPSYTITEIAGDRVVLSARGQVWAAMRTSNIRKA